MLTIQVSRTLERIKANTYSFKILIALLYSLTANEAATSMAFSRSTISVGSGGVAAIAAAVGAAVFAASFWTGFDESLVEDGLGAGCRSTGLGSYS